MIVYDHPNGGMGQESYSPRQALNVTILSPSAGSVVAPSTPLWTFGLGDKRLPVTLYVVNNTSSPQVELYLALRGKGDEFLLEDPDNPTAREEVTPGTAKEISIEAKLGWAYKAGQGLKPVTLWASAIAGLGRSVSSLPVNFTLDT